MLAETGSRSCEEVAGGDKVDSFSWGDDCILTKVWCTCGQRGDLSTRMHVKGWEFSQFGH